MKHLFAILAVVCFAGVPIFAQFAQLSSTVSQANGVIGKGVALKYNSIDAIQGITFTSGGSVVTIPTAGTYFVIAAPQVGFRPAAVAPCKTATNYTADYWAVVNNVGVANSGVRMVGLKAHKDVIVTQGIFVFNAGDKVQIFGSGVCSQSEAIVVKGEPLIPSIIFTIYKI